jgi:hypothetical protein
LLIGFIVASVHFAEAQQPKKAPRIGFLVAGPASAVTNRIEAFGKGWASAVISKARRFSLKYRFGDDKVDLLADQVAELIRLKVNVIVTAGGGLMFYGADVVDSYHRSLSTLIEFSKALSRPTYRWSNRRSSS